MNRIDARLQGRKDKDKALIAYLTAFDPDRAKSLALCLACAEAGADVLEIGVPFSDPSADGPVIQRAMLRGLAAGASLRGVLELVGDLRRRSEVPVVLFGYYNPILAYGPARFCADASAAGVDGALVVDLPPEESAELDGPLKEAGLHRIPLLSPTTPVARAARICAGAAVGGFAYYVALTGVTGAGHLDISDVALRAGALRGALRLPLAVGFGVKDRATAAALAALPACDAVVVGSALIQAHEEGRDAAALVRDLKEGISAACRSDS